MLLRAARGGSSGSGGGDSSALSPSSSSGGAAAAAPAYTTWYPPLRSTLQVLSKVYRAVDMGVFEDLAQLSVAACAESMKVGSYSYLNAVVIYRNKSIHACKYVPSKTRVELCRRRFVVGG